MKISGVTTHVHNDFPNVVHVEVGTDEGLTGLGETYYFGSSVSTFVHELVAPAILGLNPMDREAISARLRTYVGYNGSGIETRARSAVDVALWDIAGQAAGLALHDLIGGKTNPTVRLYNTCAGHQYMRASDQSSSSWGLDDSTSELEDLRAFMSDAGVLAKDLLSEGITAMKIWPFDLIAERNRGRDISAAELDEGLEPIRKIRSAVGDRMDVMVELHSLWTPSAARRIVNALRDYDIYWVEDPIIPDLLDGLEQLRGNGMPRIALGETVASRHRVQQLATRNLIDILTLDIGWCGGLTEALKLTAIAEVNGVLVAPHDCTGPASLAAATHLTTAAPNALIQETVRAGLRTWYPKFVDGLPHVSGGTIEASRTPGLGTALTATIKSDPNMTTRISTR
jgi:galactonate dehydratase